MTLSTFFSFSGDNRSSLRVYICWHAQQQADGPLLQLPDDDPPLYDAPGDSLDDSSIFSNNNSSRYFNVCVCVCGDDKRTRRRKYEMYISSYYYYYNIIYSVVKLCVSFSPFFFLF
jgi:hypothetical protein